MMRQENIACQVAQAIGVPDTIQHRHLHLREVKSDCYRLQPLHDELQPLECPSVDLIDGRALQRDLAERWPSRSLILDEILDGAGVGEVQALVDPQSKHRILDDDLVAQDVAEVLGANTCPTLAMCGRDVRQSRRATETATPLSEARSACHPRERPLHTQQ
jgi:hypothetical protein